MRSILAGRENPFPPWESLGWTIHFIERETRYWLTAQAGHKQDKLFEQGTASAWKWAESAAFIRWFTDGERRYETSLWRLASVFLKAGEAHPDYGRRKVWRQGRLGGDENQRVARTKTSGVGQSRAGVYGH